jgi:hypothetical protein
LTNKKKCGTDAELGFHLTSLVDWALPKRKIGWKEPPIPENGANYTVTLVPKRSSVRLSRQRSALAAKKNRVSSSGTLFLDVLFTFGPFADCT